MENIEKNIDREVVVTGASTSRCGYDGIMQSTPRYLEDRSLAEKIILVENAFYHWHLRLLENKNRFPQVELFTNLLWDTFFNLGQKSFTNFPESMREYEQGIVSLFKPEELYGPDLANILLANQPWFQQYEKKEFSKLPVNLTYKSLNLKYNQELLDLIQAKMPIVYHIAMDNLNIHGNERSTFSPLQILLATIAKLPVEKQKSIILSTQRRMSLPTSFEQIKTIIPAKEGYWRDRNGNKLIPPEKWRFAKYKFDRLDKSWISPIPQEIKTENKVKERTKDYDNIVIHYGEKKDRTSDEKYWPISNYKRLWKIIYPAN